ncbi:MAG TPA: class I SAM-dependent methyltransferase [Xanthobacteraceae bacterium]|nr:class I SAM-dependent methyltransferase [Xanthobacteraceae bacterium]
MAWSENHDLEARADRLLPDQRVKFLDIPYYLHLWAGENTRKRVLDFGCGSGLSAAGLALLQNSELVVGVDINSEAESCKTFLAENLQLSMPDNLVFEEIRPGQSTSYNGFDLVFSWSVFEHVNNRLYPSILKQLLDKMNPGGLFFVQIAPLYFSPEGSHLWAIGYENWEHLINQTSDVQSDIETSEISAEDRASLWSMFRTLNRITADDLLERFGNAGFDCLRSQRDQTDKEVPHSLLRAYDRAALTTFQIAALFQKPFR